MSIVPADVPSPINLSAREDAMAWTAAANQHRPLRRDFFHRIAGVVARSGGPAPRVLELGSGPGFFAQTLLAFAPKARYVALDVSAVMHSLARQRLGAAAAHITFLERDLRSPDWNADLDGFDFVVTHQAVHELRHKRYAVGLHRQVRAVLAPHGQYLMCDHYLGRDGMANGELYMTPSDQVTALKQAAFSRVTTLMHASGMALYSAA